MRRFLRLMISSLLVVPQLAQAADITIHVPEHMYAYRVKQGCEKSAIHWIFKLAGHDYTCPGGVDDDTKARFLLDQLAGLVSRGEANSMAQYGFGVEIIHQDTP